MNNIRPNIKKVDIYVEVSPSTGGANVVLKCNVDRNTVNGVPINPGSSIVAYRSQIVNSDLPVDERAINVPTSEQAYKIAGELQKEKKVSGVMQRFRMISTMLGLA